MMRGEFYIMQVLKWNDHLREIICNWAGIQYYTSEPDYLIPDFVGGDQLSQIGANLDCAHDDVFRRLLERMQQYLLGTEERKVNVLNDEDFQIFVDHRFIDYTADLLGCPHDPNDMLEALFDKDKLLELLIACGVVHQEEETPFGQLFWRLASPRGREYLFEHLGGETDIWCVLVGLINETALRIISKRFSCDQEDALNELLKKFRKSQAKNDKTIRRLETQKLDMLAIAKLKELLNAVGNYYMRHAKNVSNDLGEHPGCPRNVSLLSSIIQFYGEGNFKVALSSLFNSTQSIGSICENLEVLSTQEYKKGIRLRATLKGNNNPPRILVQFKGKRSLPWKDLCIFTFTHLEIAKHTLVKLPETSDSLPGTDDPLVDQLSTYAISLAPTKESELLSLLIQEYDSVVQFFVLSGQELAGYDDQFRSMLTGGHPTICETRALADLKTECPNPAELFDNIRKGYKRVLVL